jgi:hypothetical protein
MEYFCNQLTSLIATSSLHMAWVIAGGIPKLTPMEGDTKGSVIVTRQSIGMSPRKNSEDH